MKTYPIMLDMRGHLAVVVGAGEVGLRKVRLLLDAGAGVRLVTDQLPGDLGPLQKNDKLTVLNESYRKELLTGARLVFACTNDRQINSQIAADARAAGALVNAADQNEDCDFFVPSVIQEGEVIVAVGTGGFAPAMAAWLRRHLETALPPRIGDFAAALASLREHVRNLEPNANRRMELIKSISGSEGYEIYIQHGQEGLRRRIETAEQQE